MQKSFKTGQTVQTTMLSYVVWVLDSDLTSEADLEAVVASEAAKWAQKQISNMHMDM